MRRFISISLILLTVTGTVAALVMGQDENVPQPLPAAPPEMLSDDSLQAQPLPSEPAPLPQFSLSDDEDAYPTADSEVRPVAGPGDEDNGVIYSARRLFAPRSPSSTGNTRANPPRTLPQGSGASRAAGSNRPTTPEPPPPVAPVAEDPLPPQEGVSSVLKKKPLTTTTKPPLIEKGTATPLITRPTPSAQVSPPLPASPPSVSSRRIGSGTRAPAIRTEITSPSNLSEAGETPAPEASQEALRPEPQPLSSGTGERMEIHGEAPRLSVSASGPQSVTVGKAATYAVLCKNETNELVENVSVRLGLPSWVTMEGGEGTRGDARQETDASGKQWLVWSMQDIAPQSKEQLLVNLTVQQPQPFEFALQWTHKPAQVGTEIAVREPRLDIRLEGPGDMLQGEEKTYMLLVHNPGTGDSDNVVVEVFVGNQPANRVPVGLLAAGEQKEVPFPVLAGSRGELEIRAAAHAEGGLKADAVAKVQVRKAELQVAVGAPELKFAGGDVTYEVAVANTGDALAEQITLSIGLPVGASYVGGIDGAATAGNALSVRLGNLPPGTEKVFDVRCVLSQAGDNRFQAAVQGKGDLAASDVAVTRVEALADLKLAVNEPSGPLVVGSEATYEVQLSNRGTKAAGRVQVVVQYAQGLEPFEVAGAKAEMADGQAVFELLPEIAPGKETRLQVKARVETAGNHAFRVEVRAQDPETKLVSEGVTRCFDAGGGVRAARHLTPAAGESSQR